jgi:hypothetical protein
MVWLAYSTLRKAESCAWSRGARRGDVEICFLRLLSRKPNVSSGSTTATQVSGLPGCRRRFFTSAPGQVRAAGVALELPVHFLLLLCRVRRPPNRLVRLHAQALHEGGESVDFERPRSSPHLQECRYESPRRSLEKLSFAEAFEHIFARDQHGEPRLRRTVGILLVGQLFEVFHPTS